MVILLRHSNFGPNVDFEKMEDAKTVFFDFLSFTYGAGTYLERCASKNAA